MERGSLQLGIIIAIALGAAVSLVVLAGGAGARQGLLAHLHGFGHAVHSKGWHHADRLARLGDRLDLDADQRRKLEEIEQIVEAFHAEGPGSMGELHDRLTAQVERGGGDVDELRSVIDRHVERIRDMAYEVTERVSSLIETLDADQRETLLDHLKGMGGRHAGPDVS